jgi:hypothetical protein
MSHSMHVTHPLSNRLHPDNAKLYVIAPITNPCRYRTRYKLYEDFAKMCSDAGAELYTVEVAFGHRPFAVTEANNPRHIQLRTRSEIWHKENMINVAISRLPSDWEYVAWIDADISFARHDWVRETLNQLQHYHVIQMFSTAQDLCPNHETFQRHRGFVYSYLHGFPPTKCYSNWHPGFAWAARREAIDHLGGLIDIAILGAADRHMAFGLIGKIEQSLPGDKLDPAYMGELMRWQERAETHIHRNVGYMPGTVLHHWHGKKRDRKYKERWQILIDNKYHPLLDLKKDWQGLWALTDHNIKLRDDLRAYFRSRNEDSIDHDLTENRM